MEEPKKQLLRDPEIQPTDDTLAEIIGEKYGIYVKFISMLKDFDIDVQWRYYNDGKAWLAKGLYKWKSIRGADKEKTIFWLSIWEGFFKVNFYIAEKAMEGLQNVPISKTSQTMVNAAKPMGKLRFVPIVFEVSSDDLFDDLRVLIDYKKGI